MFSRILLGAIGVTVALSGTAQASVTTIDDVLVVTGTAGADQITFSAPSKAAFEVRTGAERVVVGRSRVSRVVVHGGAGADRIDLGSLTNLPEMVVDVGVDTVLDELKIAGTAGQDTVTVVGNKVGGLRAPVSLLAADARDRLALNTLDGDDTLDASKAAVRLQADGGLGDDVLVGGGSDDVLAGGDGQDFVSAGDGNDVALGGRGDDVLRGDAGDDVLDGGLDDDVLMGGPGTDVLLNGEVVFKD